MARERDDTNVMPFRGMVLKEDLDRTQQQLIEAAGPADSVRLLVVLDRFEGWASSSGWGDLSFTCCTAIASSESPSWNRSAGGAKA